MAEQKIKVKELIGELNISPREALKAMQDLGFPGKTVSASLTLEQALGFRSYFKERASNPVARSTNSQANVIVRKKSAKPEHATPPTVSKDSSPGVKGVEVTQERDDVSSADMVDTISNSEKPEKSEAPKSEDIKSETAKTELTKRDTVKAESSKKPPRPNVDARIISRPTDQKPVSSTHAMEKPAQPAPKPRPEKTMAEEIREKEAAEKAQAKTEAEALQKKKERGATIISKPVAPIIETPAETVSHKENEHKQPDIPGSESGSIDSAEPSNTAKSAHIDSTRKSVSPVLAEIAAKDRQAKYQEEKRAIHNKGTEQTGATPAVTQKVEGKPKAPSRPGGAAKIISRPAPTPAAARQRSGEGAPRREFKSATVQYQQNKSSYDTPFMGANRNMPPMPEPEAKEGQSKKKRLKGRRTVVEFQHGDFGRHAEEDDNARIYRGKSKRKSVKQRQPVQTTQPIKAAKRKIKVTEAIRVADMAHQMGIKANEIIKVLFGLGIMATINQSLDVDTATLVASEFDYEVEKAGFSEEDYLTPKETDAPESLKPRPPVVTIMGHVDHGKTSLLDAIRKSNITSGEAGGITQHIGAYHVKTKRGEIVFLDTPGHEAFTAMRARGAQITDLVILVVAADDGVMEQTREAISHSRAANVPILVAVNKIDKPGADPDRVLRELAELGLQPEDWGGDTVVAKVSAKTRAGLDDLLELVALQSEIMELKANPDKLARGHIVEAKLDKGRGPVATVLIQEGTLHTGDTFVCGPFSGRVRALNNDQGKKVKEAGPSMPVEVQGFAGVPDAGEEFMVVSDEKVARRIADSRAIKRREKDLASEARVTLETFLANTDTDEAQTLNLVLKADVQGTLEAITEALQKQSTDKVKINIVHGGTGAISESDILLASASKAIIIGFNVRPAARIKDIAEKENVDIRFYDIIYKLVEDVKNAMAGMLAPVQREVYLGQAEVRKIYHLPKIGAIAGSYVADGKIMRNAGVRLLREGVVAYTGKISSLKRFKEDAREVVKGNECGVGLENFNDIKEGDIIEAFETVEEAATL